jgi:hypothetical protein
MGEGVFNLDSDEMSSIFSPLKRQYGNPIINLLMGIATGNNYMPQPVNGQSMYESMIQRERSKQFAQLQSSSFGNNALFQNLGFDGSPMMSMLGMMAASPDSMTGKLLNNALGGNPMAASMQLFAGLSGANTMGAFGRTSAISVGETESVMQSLANNFYKRQEYDGPGGIREDIRKDTSKFLTREAERGPEGIEYLKQLGIKGIELGNDGKLTEESKRKIASFDLTAGESPMSQEDKNKEIRKGTTTGINKDITRLLSEQDAETKRLLDERLEKQLLARKIATKQQIESARKDGILDPNKLREIVGKYEETGSQVSSTNESESARLEVASRLETKLNELKEAVAPANATSTSAPAPAPTPATFPTPATSPTPAPTPASSQPQGDVRKKTNEMLDELLNSGVVTPEQAKNLKDEQGNPKVQEITELVTKFKQKQETAEISFDTQETEYARNMRDRIATKEMAASELSRASEGLGRAKDKKDQKNIDLYNNKIEKILETYQLAPSKEERDKYKKDEVFEPEKLEPVIDSLKTRDEAERAFKRSEFYKQRGGKYTNYDFEKSRGFKLEDFSSAFYKAADLRALGESRGLTPAEAMDKFSENAGGAMSAARSVFGDKSGSELIANMSELAGSSAIDLGSEQGAGKMEELLRKVKATQRVAGISIQTMLAVIKSGQELAANNPNLQFANSSANTELAIKAVRTAADSGRMMGGADYREAGGNQALAMGEIQESQAFAQTGLGNAYATFLGQAKGKTYTDENGNVKDSMEALKEMADNGELTGSELASGGLEKIAKILGTDVSTVAYQADNPLLAQKAMQQEDIMKAVYAAKDPSVMKTFFSGLEKRVDSSGENITQERILNKYKEAKAGGMADSVFMMQEVIPYLNPGGQQLFREQENTIMRGFRDSLRTPEEKGRMEELINKQAAEDKEVSRQLDSKRAPIVTQAISALATGAELGPDAAAEAFGNIFTTKDVTLAETKKAVNKAREAATDLNQVVSDKNMPEEEKREQVAVKINDILSARIATARERGKPTDLKATVNKEKLTLVTEGLGSMSGIDNVFKAKEKLADLEKRNSRGQLKEPQKRELAILKAAQEMNILSSDQSLKLGKSGTLEGVTAAVVQGYADEEVKDIIDKRKNIQVESMGAVLEEKSKGVAIDEDDRKEKEEIQAAMKHYTYKNAEGRDYVNWKELYEDSVNTTRKKTDSEKKNFFAQSNKKVSDDFSNVRQSIDDLDKAKAADNQTNVREHSNRVKETLTRYGVRDEDLAKIKKPDGSYDTVKLRELTQSTEDNVRNKRSGTTLTRTINETQDRLKQEEVSSAATGKGTAGEDPFQKELTEAFKSLKEMIQNGGGIKEALEGLATALTTTKG